MAVRNVIPREDEKQTLQPQWTAEEVHAFSEICESEANRPIPERLIRALARTAANLIEKV
jgi:hypothetical protein